MSSPARERPSAQEFIAAQKERVRRGDLRRRAKDIGRQGRHTFVVEAATYRKQSNMDDKVFAIERLRWEGLEGEALHDHRRTGTVEYRFGYYIVSRVGPRAGAWWWGQYAPLIPAEDLAALPEQARQEGTIVA